MDELQLAQQRVGQALDRARAGEDPALAGKVREMGEQVANLLGGLFRLSRVHAPDNRAFDQPVAELSNAMGRIQGLLGTVHTLAIEDQIYINEIRIRTPPNLKEGGTLASELAPHNVGGLTFHKVPTELEIRKLLRCFLNKPAPHHKRHALIAALQSEGVQGVEPQVLHRFRKAGEEAVKAVEHLDPKLVFERATKLVEESWDNAAVARALNPLPLRRVDGDLRWRRRQPRSASRPRTSSPSGWCGSGRWSATTCSPWPGLRSGRSRSCGCSSPSSPRPA